MDWSQYQDLLKLAHNKMNALKQELPDETSFLNKTELVISFEGCQVSVKHAQSLWNLLDEGSSLEIILESRVKNQLSRLSKEISSIRAQYAQRIISSDTMDINLAKLKAETQSINLAEIEITDAINIEMIFPNVSMRSIQKLKEHRLINQAKTCGCMACIRVYLA
jgi:hypothetical protein